MICDCGATVIPYRNHVFTWCEVCGRAYTSDCNRVSSQDTDHGASFKNDSALEIEDD